MTGRESSRTVDWLCSCDRPDLKWWPGQTAARIHVVENGRRCVLVKRVTTVVDEVVKA
jgi:hypothetical protein